jgi:hypothetical protein
MLILFSLAFRTTTTFNSFAQQSCSFIIHLDGLNGTDEPTCGEGNTPCASINYGIGRAVTENYSDIKITSNANYQEIIGVVASVNLWGGFDSQWASSGLTIITGGCCEKW